MPIAARFESGDEGLHLYPAFSLYPVTYASARFIGSVRPLPDRALAPGVDDSAMDVRLVHHEARDRFDEVAGELA